MKNERLWWASISIGCFVSVGALVGHEFAYAISGGLISIGVLAALGAITGVFDE